MAISHVWSDGTGAGTWARGIVNECLYQNFVNIARNFDCEGIWWDAISLPADRKVHTHAMNRMHENYEHASITLVHNRYLSTMRWATPAAACFALVMSPRFTRGWTAMELAASRPGTVYVLFANHRLVELGEILRGVGEVTHGYHHIASGLIRHVDVISKVTTVNDLLTILGPRYTSWARDKAIIAGLLVRVPNVASMSQTDIYQAVLRKVKTVHVGNLFHGKTTMQAPGFQWCPSDLFQMPIAMASDAGSPLKINDEGELLGIMRVGCLTRYSKTMTVLAGDNHPLIRARTEYALENPGGYLFVGHPSDFARGLILRVALRRNDRLGRGRELGRVQAEISMNCQIVGTVVLGRPEWVTEAGQGDVQMRVRLTGDADQPAEKGVYACEIVREVHREAGWEMRRQEFQLQCACRPKPEHAIDLGHGITDQEIAMMYEKLERKRYPTPRQRAGPDTAMRRPRGSRDRGWVQRRRGALEE